MDTSFNISPGEEWHPESAARFNSVSDMLNAFGTIGPGTFAAAAGDGSNNCITCKNMDDKTISAYSYVTLSHGSSTGSDVFLDTYTMKAGVTDPCGILLSDCAPGETAQVQISGLAEARTYPAPSGVVVLPGISASSRNRNLVVLNSTGHDNYRNYFKVEAEEWDENGHIVKVRIYDGGNPASSICGVTDVGAVTGTSLDGFFSEGARICLRLTVNATDAGSKYFTHTFERNDDPPVNEPVLTLAEVVRTGNHYKVIQRWTGGEIHWRDRFVITIRRGEA